MGKKQENDGDMKSIVTHSFKPPDQYAILIANWPGGKSPLQPEHTFPFAI